MLPALLGRHLAVCSAMRCCKPCAALQRALERGGSTPLGRLTHVSRRSIAGVAAAAECPPWRAAVQEQLEGQTKWLLPSPAVQVRRWLATSLQSALALPLLAVLLLLLLPTARHAPATALLRSR